MLEHIDRLDKKLPPGFNWIAILKDLAAGATITRSDHYILVGLSAAWPTCACGQLCVNIPRHHGGSPEDTRLQQLGMLFCMQIQNESWKAALATFYKIEQRTMELLNENK